jgi:hypothetical protein
MVKSTRVRLFEDDVSSVSWAVDAIVVSERGLLGFFAFARGSLWARVAIPFFLWSEGLVTVYALGLEGDRLLSSAFDEALARRLVVDITDGVVSFHPRAVFGTLVIAFEVEIVATRFAFEDIFAIAQVHAEGSPHHDLVLISLHEESWTGRGALVRLGVSV